MERKRK